MQLFSRGHGALCDGCTCCGVHVTVFPVPHRTSREMTLRQHPPDIRPEAESAGQHLKDDVSQDIPRTGGAVKRRLGGHLRHRLSGDGAALSAAHHVRHRRRGGQSEHHGVSDELFGPLTETNSGPS